VRRTAPRTGNGGGQDGDRFGLEEAEDVENRLVDLLSLDRAGGGLLDAGGGPFEGLLLDDRLVDVEAERGVGLDVVLPRPEGDGDERVEPLARPERPARLGSAVE